MIFIKLKAITSIFNHFYCFILKVMTFWKFWIREREREKIKNSNSFAFILINLQFQYFYALCVCGYQIDHVIAEFWLFFSKNRLIKYLFTFRSFSLSLLTQSRDVIIKMEVLQNQVTIVKEWRVVVVDVAEKREERWNEIKSESHSIHLNIYVKL